MVSVILTLGGGITMVRPESPCSSLLVVPKSIGRQVGVPLQGVSYLRSALRQSRNSLRRGQQWE